jgi:hypothetical protein
MNIIVKRSTVLVRDVQTIAHIGSGQLARLDIETPQFLNLSKSSCTGLFVEGFPDVIRTLPPNMIAIKNVLWDGIAVEIGRALDTFHAPTT